MTIDEARVWLQRHADNTPMPGARETYQTILVALERTRWIPVTEELPERHQMVLMYYNGTKVGYMRVGCIVDTYFGQKVWTTKEVGAIVPRCVCAPDFWMPLPEPPEKEDNQHD